MMRLVRRSVAALMALVLTACGSVLKIHDRPISFSGARQQMTLDYIGEHYGKEPEDIAIDPRMIVLHWTAIDTLEGSFAAFDPETLGGSRPDLAGAGQVNVSIQFLVDRDGAIYRLMPETWMARHVIGLNYSAIGVENVGGSDSVDNMTDEQIDTNIRLVRYLVKKYPGIEYLIGHSEYQQFAGHPLWLEQDAGYRTEKVDPGERFMSAVRRGVADLGLKGPPG
jgi:N-acetyl-anhydromuramyl-L-alanine amidase AmpD